MKKMLVKIVGLIVSVLVATSVVALADFTDMPEDATSKVALENAVSNGLLTGYDNGEIRPYNNITRAEMATIIVRAFGAKNNANISNFADMNANEWYYDFMSKAVAMEVFQGDGVNLNPKNDITFQEAFAVLARVFDLQTKYDVDLLKYRLKLISNRPTEPYAILNNYADGNKVAEWAQPTTTAILEGGYWNPADMLLRPTEPIKRVEFAILMNNLVTTYIDEPGTYASVPAGNVLIRCGNVAFNSFKSETSSIFIGDGVNGTAVGLGADVVADKVVVRGGNILLCGEYNLVRMIGHNCIIDISKGPSVKVQLYSKYKDSVITAGVVGV